MFFFSGIRKSLPPRQSSVEESTTQEATVIPNQESLIGDLLSMDLGTTAPAVPAPVAAPTSNVDLLGGGLDVLVSFSLSYLSLFYINYFFPWQLTLVDNYKV